MNAISRKRKSSLLPIILVLAAGCSRGAAQSEGSPPAPEVGVITVEAQNVALTSELAGRAAAFETSEVRPQVSGLVEARLFTEGTIVRSGQPLYRIDPSLYQAAVNEAAANMSSASAEATGARIRTQRLGPLVAAEAVSQQEYTDAQAVAASANAAVAQRRAVLDTARINLRFTRVAAPITGRIGRSLVTTGALVTSAQATPMATIQRLDPMFVDIQQSSADLLRLRQSLATGGVVPARAQVRLTLENGQAYPITGTLEFTEISVDPDTGSVTLRARFPNPQGLLLPGMFVRATLAQSVDQDAILVPQQAILRDPTGASAALVVGPGNRVVRRPVQVGRAVGNRWLISGGLRPGERIIVQGLANARPGQIVRPQPAGSRQRLPASGASS
jgi:membrane fusion protein (multidrug efflux system)